MKQSNTSMRLRAGLMAFTVLMGTSLFTFSTVAAASLTSSSIRLNRMAAGTQTSLRVVFTTPTGGGTSVVVNMNGADTTKWTTSSGAVNATQTVSSAGCATETGATALPGTITAAGNAGTGVITISSVTALTPGSSYCVDLTSASAVTNPTAGEYHPTITAGSDSTTVAVRTVTNDQVVVTASVAPTFNLALSGNTDSFGALTTAPSSTTGVTATVNTNARSGWVVWAKDANVGLTSASATKTIPSTAAGAAATQTTGTEGYSMGVGSVTQGSGSTGTAAAVAAYSGAYGGGVDTALRQIITSNGTAGGATFLVKEYAAINGATPAASDYTDTITIVGAGSF